MITSKSLSSVLVLSLLCACASNSQIQVPQTHESASEVQMNIAPGKVDSWRTTVSFDKPVMLDVTFVRLRPSEEWGPVISVCLHDSMSAEEKVCLRLLSDEKRVIAEVVQPGGEEIHKLATSENTSIHLEVGRPAHISLASTSDGIAFSINGTFLFLYPYPKTPGALSTNCSSATCKFSNIQT